MPLPVKKDEPLDPLLILALGPSARLSTLNPQPSTPWSLMNSLTCSSNLSFGFGMNPSRGLDAFALPIYEPISLINAYGR